MWAIFALLAVSLISNIVQGVVSYKTQKDTNDFNQQQYEDWKEYNSPTNQMQRLSDAGLNPYLVSNVGNTLSQPFSIGQNTGISEMLGGIANSFVSGAQFMGSHYENELNRQIQRDNLKVRQQQLNLNMIGMQIKEKLAKMNLQVGDYRSALLWAQTTGQDLANNYFRSAMPYRLQGLYLGNVAKEQEINHNAVMYPMMEDYYEPMQRARINHLYKQDSHYSFMEEFMKEKFLEEMSLKWDKYFFDVDYSWQKFYQMENFFNQRLGLSRDYFNLAKRKFKWQNLWQGLGVLNSYANTALSAAGLGMKYPGMRMRIPRF